MNSDAKVLVVSLDEPFLHTSTLILGTYFSVEGAARVSEARGLIASVDFNLVVLCASLPEAESERLAALARDHNARTTILAMGGNGSCGLIPWADQHLGVGAGSYELLKKCARILEYELKSKAKASRLNPGHLIR